MEHSVLKITHPGVIIKAQRSDSNVHVNFDSDEISESTVGFHKINDSTS